MSITQVERPDGDPIVIDFDDLRPWIYGIIGDIFTPDRNRLRDGLRAFPLNHVDDLSDEAVFLYDGYLPPRISHIFDLISQSRKYFFEAGPYRAEVYSYRAFCQRYYDCNYGGELALRHLCGHEYYTLYVDNKFLRVTNIVAFPINQTGVSCPLTTDDPEGISGRWPPYHLENHAHLYSPDWPILAREDLGYTFMIYDCTGMPYLPEATYGYMVPYDLCPLFQTIPRLALPLPGFEHRCVTCRRQNLEVPFLIANTCLVHLGLPWEAWIDMTLTIKRLVLKMRSDLFLLLLEVGGCPWPGARPLPVEPHAEALCLAKHFMLHFFTTLGDRPHYVERLRSQLTTRRHTVYGLCKGCARAHWGFCQLLRDIE